MNRGTIDYRSKVKKTALISVSGDIRRIVKLCKGSMITQLLAAVSQDKYEKGREQGSRTRFEHDHDDDYIASTTHAYLTALVNRC